MSLISPNSRRRLRVFAGPNGSGKSTLFEIFSQRYDSGVFVNADELEKKFRSNGFTSLNQFGIRVDHEELSEFISTSGYALLLQTSDKSIVKNPVVSLKDNCLVLNITTVNSYIAAWSAAFIRWLLLKRGKSFAMETVMSHHSKLDEIIAANQLGYKTYLYYVCTSDPMINLDRISERVRKGGHFVPPDKIEKRYVASLDLLNEAVSITHRAYLFDNSGRNLKLIAESFRGRLKIIEPLQPSWFLHAFPNK